MIDEKKLIEALKEHFDICEINGRVMYSDHIITSDDYVALVNFINKQPKVREWISCDEAYPEEDERVLVFDSLNNRIVCAYYSCPHWEADDGRIEVTAWQPLPESYKENNR